MNFRERSRLAGSTFDDSPFRRSMLYELPLLEPTYDRPMHGRSTYEGSAYDRPTYSGSTYARSTSERTTYDRSIYDEPTFSVPRSNGSKLAEARFYRPSTYGQLSGAGTVHVDPRFLPTKTAAYAPPPFRSDSAPNNSWNTTCPHCHHLLKTVESSPDTFKTALQKSFPGAYELEKFVFQTKQTLVPKGFYPHVNTFVCVGLCRDEITSPFEEEVEAMWGQAFICGSLGGMLFCGNTGFAAAHHHAPATACIIYYCFTHIAIDQEGVIGSVYRTRSGMSEKTTACGALAAFTNEIASNKLNLAFDENDIEMSMLRKHIVNKSGLSTDPANAPDLLKVTMAAYETITMDLERHARHDAEKFKDRRYALFTGVQIHGPDGSDYCWLGKASLLVNGQISPLVLTTKTSSQPLIGPPAERH